MTEPSPLPGDPSELHLRISYDDGLWDTPQADTLECWNVAVLHRRRAHGEHREPVSSSGCAAADCSSCSVEDVAVGSMTFYRVHLDRGRNAYWAMEEESEELYETAQVLLDPETGSFTDEVSERLEYVGSALLVMNRVTLDPPWRGHGLAAVLACEVITRLMAGCRAVACSPGITDLSSRRLTARAEWDRVNAKIAQGWESLGFRPYRDNVFLLSPASQDLEEQRGALRQHLADLGGLWRTDAARSVSLAGEAGSPESL
ncbi:hypothetical protein OIE75_28415 [Streptomyces sp. NBC_01723]|uniref:hypothetical protein n=1 Tax=unclassified Streptomyces TaxID=2593676 RepID=UPI002E37A3A6|nr:hypothetical protein [Streptomyces sp. NBC_01723]